MRSGTNIAEDLNIQGAWVGFLHRSLLDEPTVAAFTAATGLKIPSPPKALIDKATGYDRETARVVKEFALWITENLWGVEYAPESVRREIEERRK